MSNRQPRCQPRTQALLGFSLMAFMLATRFHHFGDALHLPDASWALFFLAGFYLSPAWLLGLMLEAVAIDVAAVGWMGVSGYCLTPAYAGLQLAHLALWTGGRLSSRQIGADAAAVARMAGLALGATVLAFVISNASFYWFGGRVADTSLAQFARTFVDYGPRFLSSTLIYLLVAALAHGLAVNLAGGRGAGLPGTR
ncbi:MAG: hypothetical protein KBF24_09705 [Thiobacillaceae bacterium]|jgi:hypothetical protein|nr:hypothetical protein [Hydrogenophilales bacterium]MBP8901959.1 hypothetical protein [Thiobacillaceae bacterium]MBP9916469.1 hypothetical protein [Thiobacillaceae bacterium]